MSIFPKASFASVHWLNKKSANFMPEIRDIGLRGPGSPSALSAFLIVYQKYPDCPTEDMTLHSKGKPCQNYSSLARASGSTNPCSISRFQRRGPIIPQPPGGNFVPQVIPGLCRSALRAKKLKLFKISSFIYCFIMETRTRDTGMRNCPFSYWFQ
jgi:hypothetical protein